MHFPNDPSTDICAFLTLNVRVSWFAMTVINDHAASIMLQTAAITQIDADRLVSGEATAMIRGAYLVYYAMSDCPGATTGGTGSWSEWFYEPGLPDTFAQAVDAFLKGVR